MKIDRLLDIEYYNKTHDKVRNLIGEDSPFFDTNRGKVCCIGLFQLDEEVIDAYKNKAEEILDEEVEFTYSFTTAYYKHSFMIPHLDHHACDISFSVHLYGDHPWELKKIDLNDNLQTLNLDVGESLFYHGPRELHWREPYLGNFYNQLFIHFVRKSYEHFDTAYEIVSTMHKLNLFYCPNTVDRVQTLEKSKEENDYFRRKMISREKQFEFEVLQKRMEKIA